jgi:hypothetical protein
LVRSDFDKLGERAVRGYGEEEGVEVVGERNAAWWDGGVVVV